MKPKKITAYHLTAATLRDGSPIPAIGKWLKHDGPVVPCKSGLHASGHPLDALRYAPGNLLHRVELRGNLQAHGDPVDKWVGRERRIIATIDAEKVMRDFAKWCALSVIHLWYPPQVVLDYLCGDDTKRAAARAAALAAARDAAGDAAGDAARAAARAAQRAKFAELVDEAFAPKTKR